jgi:hypothetical protein
MSTSKRGRVRDAAAEAVTAWSDVLNRMDAAMTAQGRIETAAADAEDRKIPESLRRTA